MLRPDLKSLACFKQAVAYFTIGQMKLTCNNLSVNAVECSSINLFKNLIDNYWTNKQYVYCIA